MITTLGDHITPTRPLNNYTIELLKKYPNLRVLRRCNENNSCTFCILCILSYNRGNRITYLGITYSTDYTHHKNPELNYHPSTVYDTLTTDTYYWSFWDSTDITDLDTYHTIFTIEEALPILEQEIMMSEL